MHITLVSVWVTEGQSEAFLAATRANQAGSRAEPGNIRFDILRVAADPQQFRLLEIFQDEAAAKAHKQTPHYLRWRETVAAMMARPRQGEQLLAEACAAFS